MRLPSKQVLLRLYPVWEGRRQRHMAARISVQYGPAFLRLLRSKSSKSPATQQEASSVDRRGKHKRSPCHDGEKGRKRLKLDEAHLSHSEVSSNMDIPDQEPQGQDSAPEGRLTRSAAKLLLEKGGLVPLDGQLRQADENSNDVKCEVIHALALGEGKEGKIVSEDENKVSSSLGPKSEQSPVGQNKSINGQPEPCVTIGQIEQEREVFITIPTEGRHKRKSLHPRRKLPRGYQDDHDEDQGSHGIGEDRCGIMTGQSDQGVTGWSVAEKGESGQANGCPGMDKAPVHASPAAEVGLEEGVPEETPRPVENILRNEENLSGIEQEGDPAKQTFLTDQDPMLGEGSQTSESQGPPSAQATAQENWAADRSGLLFQSLGGITRQDGVSEDGGNAEAASEYPAVVNSSVTETTDPEDCFDNLLPGLNLLHVGRAGIAEESALRWGGTGHVTRKVHKKKSKNKKLKHKSPKKKLKSKTTIASPSRHSSSKSPLPMTSPVFKLALPVSNWTSLDNPIGSSYKGHSSGSFQLTPHQGDVIGSGGKPVEHLQRMDPDFEEKCKAEMRDKMITPSKVCLTDCMKTGPEPAVPRGDSQEEREDILPREQPDPISDLTKQPSSSLPSVAEGTPGGAVMESLHFKAVDPLSWCDEIKDSSTPVSPDEGTTNMDAPQSQREAFAGASPEGSDSAHVGLGRQKNSADKKMSKKKKRSDASSPRGTGGWEESLRQRPQRVALFQAGTMPRKGGVKSATKKNSLSKMQTSIKEKESQATGGSAASTPRLELLKKKKPRKVLLPPGVEESTEKKANKRPPDEVKTEGERDESFPRGQLVFGKMKGYCWWPGRIVHHFDRNIHTPPPPLTRWVQWFGDNKFSLLSLGQIVDFENFTEYFASFTFQKVSLYQKACCHALNAAARRAEKEFSVAMPTPTSESSSSSVSVNERRELKTRMLARFQEMKEWADGGFQPKGPNSIRPTEDEKQPPPPPKSPPPSPEREGPTGSSLGKKRRRKSSDQEVFVDKRGKVMEEVRAGIRTVEEICIGCGSLSLAAKHPLFHGGLCEVCRVEYLEVAYLFDSEGYQAHCCVCGEGSEITLCGTEGCHHSYCTDCMDYLVGPQESKRVAAQEPWSCYLCAEEDHHGYLKRRSDWQQQMVDFFNCDRFMEFEPLRVYKPLLLAERRPIRVLALFDGIGTGMLVLRELGLDVECYIASEISEEAIMVAAVRLQGQIKQVGDVQKITTKELASWGPFDLLIGGSPCNDLSIVNPARRGLAGGSGLLFFDFYRILRTLQPRPDDPRPFFWLFENVVAMGRRDKHNICRFLECHPVMIDSRHMSPTHRARYYWGNLPGMDRPYVAGADNPLSLQECLEPHCDRQAQFSKVATITTRSNSIRQTKDAILPVIMNGREDGLWATELERLFGFPDHYTDVGNLSRTARQKLLGKAWSVPVIRHLMAPLKDYFACRAGEGQ